MLSKTESQLEALNREHARLETELTRKDTILAATEREQSRARKDAIEKDATLDLRAALLEEKDAAMQVSQEDDL